MKLHNAFKCKDVASVLVVPCLAARLSIKSRVLAQFTVTDCSKGWGDVPSVVSVCNFSGRSVGRVCLC